MMEKEIKISLIIPTYNKVNRLKYLLESLCIQDAEIPFTVIIVDDGSTDGSKMLIEKYRSRIDLKVYTIQNSGRSHARNVGLEMAKTKYVIFCDDDMILPPAYVKENYTILSKNKEVLVHGKIYNLPYLSFFEDPESGTIFPEIIEKSKGNIEHIKKYLITTDIVNNQEELEKQRRISLQEKYAKEIYEKNIEELFFLMCTGGNFSCRRELLLQVGGFNEEIDLKWGTEDIELGYRLQKSGVDFLYSQETYNYHICHYRTTYESELLYSFELFYKEHKDPLILDVPNLLLRKVKNLEEFIEKYVEKKRIPVNVEKIRQRV